MAFLLQCQNYVSKFPKPFSISLQKQETSIDQTVKANLLSFLSENQHTLALREMDIMQENIIAFEIVLTNQVSLVCRWYIASQKDSPLAKITFYHQDKYWCVKSKELFKNICRTLKEINHMLGHSHTFIVVSPQTGETQLKISSYIMRSNISLEKLKHTVLILVNSLDNLKAITPILLYTCNIITQTQMRNTLKPSIKKGFYKIDKDHSRFTEIYELSPLVNSHYAGHNPSNIEDYCYKFDQVLDLYYNQLQKSPFKDYLLFSFSPQLSQEPLINIQGEFKQLNFPMQVQRQLPFVLSTIYITQHMKERQYKIFQGGKSKIIASPTKFIYDHSVNVNQERKQETERPADTYMIEKKQYQKTLLVKAPRETNTPNAKRQLMAIRYEKEVLTNFRTSKCRYLPRYYHTIQQRYEYNHLLLMDYVQCPTLSIEMLRRSMTNPLVTKLFILNHIANAIRFLEQYQVAHLDLKPDNILVDQNKCAKLIDFGQAYHPASTKKFVQLVRKDYDGFVYSPGRTFPYASPQTSTRMTKFSSQQDMFSFGVILYQFLFNNFPLSCSEPVLKEIYQSKRYTQRLFISPERAEDYGQADFMFILMHLIIKLLNSDQTARPFPLWTYLIIKKLMHSFR